MVLLYSNLQPTKSYEISFNDITFRLKINLKQHDVFFLIKPRIYFNIDCGEPRGEGFSMEHVREWDAIGITRGMHITCAAKYNQLGSELFVCRSNGTWRTDLSCHKNYGKIILSYMHILSD